MAAPTSNPSAFSAFLKGLNRQQPRGPAADPKVAILRLLAGGPRTFGHVAKLTGIPLDTLMQEIGPLQEYGLLRREEQDGEVLLRITQGGLDLLRPDG